MREDLFSIEVDVGRDLVRMTLSGFFTSEDIARFNVARLEAYSALRCEPNQHVTLIDIREMHIQAQARIGDFQQGIADPRTAAKRLAFVVARSLARLQVQRAAQGREAGYFTSVEEAEAWLLGPDAAVVGRVANRAAAGAS